MLLIPLGIDWISSYGFFAVNNLSLLLSQRCLPHPQPINQITKASEWVHSMRETLRYPKSLFNRKTMARQTLLNSISSITFLLVTQFYETFLQRTSLITCLLFILQANQRRHKNEEAQWGCCWSNETVQISREAQKFESLILSDNFNLSSRQSMMTIGRGWDKNNSTLAESRTINYKVLIKRQINLAAKETKSILINFVSCHGIWRSLFLHLLIKSI